MRSRWRKLKHHPSPVIKVPFGISSKKVTSTSCQISPGARCLFPQNVEPTHLQGRHLPHIPADSNQPTAIHLPILSTHHICRVNSGLNNLNTKIHERILTSLRRALNITPRLYLRRPPMRPQIDGILHREAARLLTRTWHPRWTPSVIPTHPRNKHTNIHLPNSHRHPPLMAVLLMGFISKYTTHYAYSRRLQLQ